MEKLFSEITAAPLVRRLRDHCDCFAFEQGIARTDATASLADAGTAIVVAAVPHEDLDRLPFTLHHQL